MRNRICSSRGPAGVFLGDRLLHRDGAFDGVDGTREIGDHAVAGGVEDAAVMDRDQMVEDHPVGLQPAQGADFVDAHQPAVLGDVGGKDGGELSFDRRAVYHQRPPQRRSLPTIGFGGQT